MNLRPLDPQIGGCLAECSRRRVRAAGAGHRHAWRAGRWSMLGPSRRLLHLRPEARLRAGVQALRARRESAVVRDGPSTSRPTVTQIVARPPCPLTFSLRRRANATTSWRLSVDRVVSGDRLSRALQPRGAPGGALPGVQLSAPSRLAANNTTSVRDGAGIRPVITRPRRVGSGARSDRADSSERRNCEREWRLRWSKPWNRVGFVVPAVGHRISRSASSG